MGGVAILVAGKKALLALLTPALVLGLVLAMMSAKDEGREVPISVCMQPRRWRRTDRDHRAGNSLRGDILGGEGPTFV
jgi:hypothetical protein